MTFPGDVGIHDDKTKPFQHILNSDDRIFTLIRDKHITTCVMGLTAEIKNLKRTEETNLDALSPAKMKEFVKNIPQHKADQRNLEIHWNGCEYIFKRIEELAKTGNLPDAVGGEPILARKLAVEELLLDGTDINEAISFIQECIARRYKMSVSLRLLCLLSTTYSGIPTKEFNDLKVIIDSYSYPHLIFILAPISSYLWLPTYSYIFQSEPSWFANRGYCWNTIE